MRNLHDISLLSSADVLQILDRAKVHNSRGYTGNRAIMYFGQPSTRTRLSFARALTDLGIAFQTINESESKVATGESWSDTCVILTNYCDFLIVRHTDNLAAHKAVYQGMQVISAGCGRLHHPTQALVDAFVLRSEFKTLENRSIAFVGNIDSRSVRSFASLLMKFTGTKLYYVTHPSLAHIPAAEGLSDDVYTSLFDVPSDIDALYFVRFSPHTSGLIYRVFRKSCGVNFNVFTGAAAYR